MRSQTWSISCLVACGRIEIIMVPPETKNPLLRVGWLEILSANATLPAEPVGKRDGEAVRHRNSSIHHAACAMQANPNNYIRFDAPPNGGVPWSRPPWLAPWPAADPRGRQWADCQSAAAYQAAPQSNAGGPLNSQRRRLSGHYAQAEMPGKAAHTVQC